MNFWTALRWVGTALFVGAWLMSCTGPVADGKGGSSPALKAAPTFHR